MAEQKRKEGRRMGKAQVGGFTLIELLVVMSIISLLMSIMLPNLSAAREQAKRIHCAANLKNLMYAWFMYADDYDGRLCSADTGWNHPGNNWVADGTMMPGNVSGGTEYAIEEGVLWPYLSIFGSYKCKSDAGRLVRSYSMSRTMNGKNCNCDQDNINPFRTLGEITRPAERLVFVDADSREEWIDGSFSPVKQIDADPPEWYCAVNRNITARHSEGMNLTLADGHWEYYRYKDARTVQLAKWEMGPDEASPNNPDLRQMVEWMRGIGQ